MPGFDVSPGVGGLVPVYQTTVVGTSTTTFDTGAIIPPGFNVLELFVFGQTSEASLLSSPNITFNGDNGSNYDQQNVYSTGTTAQANTQQAQTKVQGYLHGNSTYASSMRLTIPGYASTSLNKAVIGQYAVPDTTSGSFIVVQAHGWRSTAAINRVTLALGSGHYMPGTQLSVYVF